MRKRTLLVVLCALLFTGIYAQPRPGHDLNFDKLAGVWDESIPLGNGSVGALIWQKEGTLRFSLDRADIWDMRPMAGLHRDEFRFKWIQEQIKKDTYKSVQEYLDKPYDLEPAPTKIPAGALEFEIPSAAEVQSVNLSLEKALCEVKWKDGLKLTTFVHATDPVGWFRFENIGSSVLPRLIAPGYQGKEIEENPNSLIGDHLGRLGYKQGTIETGTNQMVYKQEGWGGFVYEISVKWKKTGSNSMEGVWSISSHYPGKPAVASLLVVGKSMERGMSSDYKTHLKWWDGFWRKSSVSLPDSTLERQWYREQYKFGSSARKGAPPISLQAVWTADNGRIPPWKGDFHHDLNTQLSYWPGYSANHLEETMGYLDHLEENKENYKRFTRLFFETDGLAVPGVTTLDGSEMGGWVPYSLSPTVSAWLAQHYYLQWKFGMDRRFLKDKAYPWFKETCIFLEQITLKDGSGRRKLPISSSPEINDNRVTAWFPDNTNYDLALMKFVFGKASELAAELSLNEEAAHWRKLLDEFGDYALTDKDEMMFAPTMEYNQSHRHFSHLMAIHPLSLINWEDGEKSRSIIKNTIALLDKIGPDYWVGYSYAWLGNLKARAKDGDGAAEALSIFAKAFCLPNSFHVNGDQTASGLSKFVYRPFTLEGNFAFAAGVQEMLLQSHAGVVDVFPALPAGWRTAGFRDFLAQGGFMVSAEKTGEKQGQVKVVAAHDGEITIRLPFDRYEVLSKNSQVLSKEGAMVKVRMRKGETIQFKSVR